MSLPILSKAQSDRYFIQHFNDENGLPNIIKNMQVDSNGFVWFATESGLVRFDGTRFKMFNRSESGQAVNRLFNVNKAPDGKIFVKTETQGFFFVDDHNLLQAIEPDQLSTPPHKLMPLIGSAAKLINGCRRKYNASLLPQRYMPAATISRSYINSITLLGQYYFYQNTQNEIIAADTLFKTFSMVRLTRNGIYKKLPDSASHVPITLAQQDNRIYVRWADTLYELHFSVDKKTAEMHPELPVGNIEDITGFLRLPGQHTSIVSTIGDGIYIFKKQLFSTLRSSRREANIFYAQAPFGMNGVLTGKGIFSSGIFAQFPTSFFVSAILRSTNNQYYLNRRDHSGSHIYQLDNSGKKLKEIPFGGAAYCFRQTPDGTVWLSADTGFLAHIVHDSVQWIARPPSMPSVFFITTFIETGEHAFWIGGKQGLIKVDIAANKIYPVPELQGLHVRALYEDKLGTLWIGTYGNGFYALRQKKVISFPVDPKGYLEYVHCFMPDAIGRIWITTNRGLFLFNTNDLYSYLNNQQMPPFYYYFDKTAGFLTNEFNGGCNPAGISLDNGKFSFPSLNGLVQFYPDSVYPVPPTARIFVDKVLADTSELFLAGNTFVVPKNTQRIKFYISSPYFGNEYNQRIEYCIDHGSGKWQRLNGDGIIETDNPTKGNHELLLRKQTGFGPGSTTIAQIHFYVQPFFWETIVFRILLLLSVVTLGYWLYRLRIRLLLRQKNKLEQLVADKTQEQQVLITDLEAVVTELEQSQQELEDNITFKETLAMIISHDLQSPLRFLSSAFQQIDMETGYANSETKELGMELKRTSTKIYQFVKDFGIWIERMSIRSKTDLQSVDLSGLLLQIADFFADLQRAQNNKVVLNLRPCVCVHTDYQMLKIILHNIIDNAIKNTEGGTIEIILDTKENYAIVKIKDTGKGMRESVLADLKKSSHHGYQDLQHERKTATGLGYRFISDFCRILRIDLHLESRLEKGTIVTLSNLQLCHQVS